MRLFVGIPFPRHVAERIDVALAPLRMAFRGIAWVSPNIRNPKVVFLSAADSLELVGPLHQNVETALSRRGISVARPG